VCLCLCICISVCALKCIRAHNCMFARLRVRVCVYVCVSVCMCACACVCLCALLPHRCCSGVHDAVLEQHLLKQA